MKVFLWGLSAMAFLFACATIDIMLEHGTNGVFLYAGMISVCMVLCVYLGYRAWHYGDRQRKFSAKLALKDFSGDEAKLMSESWQKAVTDYDRISAACETIRDGALRQQLLTMQRIAANLLTYLEKHPRSISSARRFIDTYQDRAASMAEEFRELEKTGLDTAQVTETQAHIKETLASFDEAYEKEFERVLGEKLLDMDAELSVLQKTMEADGIQNTSAPDRQEQAEEKHVPDEKIRAGEGKKDFRQTFSSPFKGGHGPINRAGRKQPRRRIFRTEEVLPAVMPPELRSSVLKEKLIMSALAIFGGAIGAHKFYQGKTKWGIFYLLFWWTAIPGIVGFIEGVRYLFMSMDDFYNQYYRHNGR